MIDSRYSDDRSRYDTPAPVDDGGATNMIWVLVALVVFVVVGGLVFGMSDGWRTAITPAPTTTGQTTRTPANEDTRPMAPKAGKSNARKPVTSDDAAALTVNGVNSIIY